MPFHKVLWAIFHYPFLPMIPVIYDPMSHAMSHEIRSLSLVRIEPRRRCRTISLSCPRISHCAGLGDWSGLTFHVRRNDPGPHSAPLWHPVYVRNSHGPHLFAAAVDGRAWFARFGSALGAIVLDRNEVVSAAEL
jgi:hypothetical protein